jgi:hypothetical protein
MFAFGCDEQISSVCFVVASQADADICASIPDDVARVCKLVKEEFHAIVLRIAGYVRDVGCTILMWSTLRRTEAPAYLPRRTAVRIEHLFR